MSRSSQNVYDKLSRQGREEGKSRWNNHEDETGNAEFGISEDWPRPNAFSTYQLQQGCGSEDTQTEPRKGRNTEENHS